MSRADIMDHGQIWEEYARAEPYWSVLTEDRFVRAELTDDRRKDFFDTGRLHVECLLGTLRHTIDPSFTAGRVLDFGSGTGRIAIPFAQLGSEVLGLDVSPSMVAEAGANAARFGLDRCRFQITKDFDWDAAGEFDLVHSFLVLQHIPEAEGLAIFDRLLARLAAGGIAAVQLLFASKYVRAPRPPANSPGKERPCAHLAPMLMATYDMNKILAACNALGSGRAHLAFTNDGPYAGCFVCVQRPRTGK